MLLLHRKGEGDGQLTQVVFMASWLVWIAGGIWTKNIDFVGARMSLLVSRFLQKSLKSGWHPPIKLPTTVRLFSIITWELSIDRAHITCHQGTCWTLRESSRWATAQLFQCAGLKKVQSQHVFKMFQCTQLQESTQSTSLPQFQCYRKVWSQQVIMFLVWQLWWLVCTWQPFWAINFAHLYTMLHQMEVIRQYSCIILIQIADQSRIYVMLKHI